MLFIVAAGQLRCLYLLWTISLFLREERPLAQLRPFGNAARP